MSVANKSQALSRLNALRLACEAHEVIEVANVVALEQAIEKCRRSGRQIVTFGDGTNVVLGEYLDCIVLLMRARGWSLRKEGGSHLLTAAAGERWHDLVRFALAQGAFGLENLALIPGRVGAAPIQNIGAYGLEFSEVFDSLEAIHRETGERRRFSRDECGFGYRTSLFKRAAENPWIIWQVTLRLERGRAPRIDYKDLVRELDALGIEAQSAMPVDVAEAVVRVRKRKLPDPLRMPNAGSFFKNPIVSLEAANALRARMPDLVAWPMGEDSALKISAAQLIDRAGLKGVAMAGARVWTRQPLVLVNENAQTAREFLQLAEHVRATVQERWGVKLEFEPDFYPSLT